MPERNSGMTEDVTRNHLGVPRVNHDKHGKQVEYMATNKDNHITHEATVSKIQAGTMIIQDAS
jgi:hypothetical protein